MNDTVFKQTISKYSIRERIVLCIFHGEAFHLENNYNFQHIHRLCKVCSRLRVFIYPTFLMEHMGKWDRFQKPKYDNLQYGPSFELVLVQVSMFITVSS